MRNEGGELPLTKMIYAGLPECCRLGFVHRLDEVKRDSILCGLEDLDGVIATRRDALSYYVQRLTGLNPELLYPYAPGAVPWRFNLLISDYETRQILIRECLRRKLPVSDWYPRVTPIFQSTKLFPGAEQHERQIVNFPLLADRDEIDSICELLLEYL
jgi:dTDP-4-amino-4,6-dideoxygalactose transaminase